MLKPSDGIETAIECIVEAVLLAGSFPCPPVVVGVGIGGTADLALSLAKKQTFLYNSPSESEEIAKLESLILNKINEKGCGVQGFGGNNTALKVKIATYPTHIAGLPVGVSIQCNALRFGEVVL
jgi:fumarate hydratase subunit alpha